VIEQKKIFKYFIIIILILSLTGSFVLLFLTHNYKIGLSPDSVAYIAAARNIVNGNGTAVLYDKTGTQQLNLWAPMHENEVLHILPWPPLYPLVLSLPLKLGFDIFESIRWINVLLFGITIFIISFIIYKFTNSCLLSIISCLTLFFSKELLHIFSNAWSEPLFFVTGFLGIYFLILFIKNEKNYSLIISAIFISLSFFTRTAGISFVALGIIYILFFNNLKIARKLLNLIIFLIITCLPTALWILRTKLISSKVTAELVFHLPSKADLIEILSTISAWIFSGRVPINIRVLGLLIIITAIISLFLILTTKYKNNQAVINNQFNIKIITFLIIYIALYFLTLFFSKTFFDANVPLGNDRILAPVLIASIVIIFLFVKIIIDVWGKLKSIKILTYSFLSIFILSYIFSCLFGTLVRSIYYNGQGYSSSKWTNSETIREVKKLTGSKQIYTNEPDAVYILADINPIIFPVKYSIYTQKPNMNHDKQVSEMIKYVKLNNGVIVFFDLSWGFLNNEKEITNSYPLKLIKDTNDGSIYEVK